MKIYIKIGTHPAQHMYVCRKVKPPIVGETINVKRETESWWPTHRVLIDDIKEVHGQTLYFAAGFHSMPDCNHIYDEYNLCFECNQEKPATMLATEENLTKHWLSGTTCRHYTNTKHWVSPCKNYILMKHHGHTEYIGRDSGSVRCATHYDLFDTRERMPKTLEDSWLFHKEGRWLKADWEKLFDIVESE